MLYACKIVLVNIDFFGQSDVLIGFLLLELLFTAAQAA